MQLCVRHRDGTAVVAHYLRVEETLWGKQGLLLSWEVWLFHEMAFQATHEMCELIERGKQTRA